MGLRFAHPTITKGRKNHHASFDGYAVTPSDTVDLPNGYAQAILVTGAGAVAVQLDDDTTATGIYALYNEVPQFGG
jgi:Flp pilus assembly protein CpaB